MEEIPFIIYELATVLAPCLVVFALVTRHRNKKGVSNEKERLLPLVIFAVYIAAVLNVTGAGTLYDFLRTGFEYRPHQINLMPLVLDSYPAQYTLNAIMFIPFGFLLPLIWPQVAKVGWTALYGLGFSLVIELSQLLNQRATDIDDLLMNTLGALIGFALFALFRKLGKIKRREPFGSKALPALYIGAMFVVHFLLYNGLGLAKLLYGF